MSSGAEVARQSVKATFILVSGNIVSTGILTITVLIIARLLGPNNYGLYTLTLVIPNFLQLLAGFGINAAVTRYAAFHLSRGEVETARRMTKNAILFLLFLGLFLSALNFLAASLFSSIVLNRPELTPYLQIASIFVVGQTVLQCVISAFIGFNLTSYASISTISQSVLKLSISPTLIFLGFGVLGAVFAHVVSYLIVGSFAAATIYVVKLRASADLKGYSDAGKNFEQISSTKKSIQTLVSYVERSRFFQDIKEMARYGLPTFAGITVSLFSQQFYLIVILAAIGDNVTVGFYQAAFNVTQTITLISSAVALSLFPAFARLDGMNRDTGLAFTHAIKYVSLVMTPVVFFLLGASDDVIRVFYGTAYSQASDYMSVLALSYLPLALGLTVLPPFFNGIGKTRLTMMMFLSGAASIFVLAPAFGLVLGLGVFGLIYSLIISNLLASAVGIYFAKKYADARVDYRMGARIYVVSFFCYVALYILSLLEFEKYLSLVADIVVFLALYLTLVPVLRVISRDDLKTLRTAASGLGFISKVLNPILGYENYLVNKILPKSGERTET